MKLAAEIISKSIRINIMNFQERLIIIIIIAAMVVATQNSTASRAYDPEYDCFHKLDVKLSDVVSKDIENKVREGSLEVPTFNFFCEGVSGTTSDGTVYGKASGGSGIPAFETREYKDIPFLSTTHAKNSEYNAKVEPNDPIVKAMAHKITSKYPGKYSVNQICALYDYAYEGWKYVNDPPGGYYSSASESLKRGENEGCVGAGDCEDFAILMASLIQAIGGKTRIVYTSNSDSAHAYAEVYIGSSKTLSKERANIMDAIDDYYENENNKDLKRTFYHQNWYTYDTWLSLDWFDPKQPGSKYLNGDNSQVDWEDENLMKTPYARDKYPDSY
jgi:hypothetical protein